jgi:hypothetical protein
MMRPSERKRRSFVNPRFPHFVLALSVRMPVMQVRQVRMAVCERLVPVRV